jgi:hypothetical protein
MITVSELKSLVSIADLLRRHGSAPDAQGRWRCPFPAPHRNGDAHPSVTIKDGRAWCWSQKCLGEKGADIFELIGLLEKLSTFKDQRRRIEELAGLPHANGKPNTGGSTVTAFEVCDRRGALVAIHERVEQSGDKRFLWRQPDGTVGLNGYRTEDLPLYGSEIEWTDSQSPVILVEGEKSAESLWWAGVPALGTVTGANGAPSLGVLEVLRDKHVILWPDADEPGRAHMQRMAERLAGIAKSVNILEWSEAPPKGDAADFVALYRQDPALSERLHALLESAKPWRIDEGPMPFTSLGDLLNEPEDTRPWVLEGRLPVGGLSLLAGKPKAGKSTMARCLALAVARGVTFLGFPTSNGPVLYLALEEKRSEVRRHFREMGATIDDPIYIFCAPSPVDGLLLLRKAADRYTPLLVIVDPLFRFTRVKDANDYAAVTTALEPLGTLARETGAGVLAVHHLGKGDREGGDNILGSTAIFAAVDTALLLKRTEKYRTLGSVQRYGEDLDEITLTWDPTARTLAAGPSRDVADQAAMGDAILDYLTTIKEPVEEKVILDQLEGRRGVKVKALRALVGADKVVKTGRGGKADPFKYAPAREQREQEPGPELGNKNLDATSSSPSRGSCSVVPSLLREQENKKPKTNVSTRNIAKDSCSHDFGLFASMPEQESREVGAGVLDVYEEDNDAA